MTVMTAQSVVTSMSSGVATVTLNRPEVHNAYDSAMVGELTATLRRLGAFAAVRCVVLRANGDSFCSGVDLNWLRATTGPDSADNLADARRLADLMHTLNHLPKPTIALVQGTAVGGGIGLVACCDIALAAETANFCLSEVRLGFVPAVIGPYIVQAMGARAVRRYALTGERFSALEARRLGLVHDVVPAHMLDAAARRILEHLAEGGPQAQATVKNLLRVIDQRAPEPVPVPDAVIQHTVTRIAELRASEEGREGIAAFLEKRKPGWRGQGW